MVFHRYEAFHAPSGCPSRQILSQWLQFPVLSTAGSFSTTGECTTWSVVCILGSAAQIIFTLTFSIYQRCCQSLPHETICFVAHRTSQKVRAYSIRSIIPPLNLWPFSGPKGLQATFPGPARQNFLTQVTSPCHPGAKKHVLEFLLPN